MAKRPHKMKVDPNDRMMLPKPTLDHSRFYDHGDDGDAFVPDVARTHERLVDDEAEAFAEEFIAGATSGEFVGEDARDEWVADEVGGPFLLVDINRHNLHRLAAGYEDDEDTLTND